MTVIRKIANAKSHTHLQFAPAKLKPKIAKEYVFANADRRTKKKYDCPTMAIRNAGESADMKVSTLRNQIGLKLESKGLEVPYHA